MPSMLHAPIFFCQKTYGVPIKDAATNNQPKTWMLQTFVSDSRPPRAPALLDHFSSLTEDTALPDWNRKK